MPPFASGLLRSFAEKSGHPVRPEPLYAEIRRLFARGVGVATIAALLRCTFRDVNIAISVGNGK